MTKNIITKKAKKRRLSYLDDIKRCTKEMEFLAMLIILNGV